ncbi:MAG: AraC family transcriptional regulator [Burkholderiaceae bacterium]
MKAATEKDTVAMHFVRAALAHVPPAAQPRLLGAAGIAEDLLRAPQARVTADAFAALWLGVARELDDEFFGLDRRRMKAGTFGLLCRAALHGRDLGHALQRLMHGFALVFDDVAASLELVQRRAVVRIDNRIATPEARRFADETMLVMLHGVLCWLAGRRLPLLEVAFAHPRPAHADEYRSMFCQRLRFDAPCTAMVFDGRMLRAAVVQSEATLRVFLQAAPRSVFLKYRNPEGWSARLRRRLRSGLDQGALPAFNTVAREWRVAPTTLRRRLDAEGATFQGIKDDLRRDSAIHQLAAGGRSVNAIALDLGFHEPSAFRRAFRKWTGVQPLAYRVRESAPASAT